MIVGIFRRLSSPGDIEFLIFPFVNIQGPDALISEFPNFVLAERLPRCSPLVQGIQVEFLSSRF